MNLTNEAKIHLACEVDNYIFSENHSTMIYKPEEDRLISIVFNYNPHEIEGAKYLRDILSSLTTKQEIELCDFLPDGGRRPLFDCLTYGFQEPADLVESILKVTNYKGKVWEE